VVDPKPARGARKRPGVLQRGEELQILKIERSLS
jgi:hypothetical protein